VPNAPQFNKVEQLYYNNALQLSDFNGDYIGAAQGKSSNPFLVTVLNFVVYREIHVLLRAGTLSGGTTPSLQVNLWGLPMATPASLAEAQSQVSSGQLIVPSASGGAMVAALGAAYYSAGATGINAYPLVLTNKALFGLLQVQANGSPSGMTGNAILGLYGVRD
jgi:hypothetical protein